MAFPDRRGRLALEVVTAIYQSGACKAAVSLPLGQDAPLYTGKGILEHARCFHINKKSKRP